MNLQINSRYEVANLEALRLFQQLPDGDTLTGELIYFDGETAVFSTGTELFQIKNVLVPEDMPTFTLLD